MAFIDQEYGHSVTKRGPSLAQIEFYVFQCDCVDVAERIRSLKGSCVLENAVVKVACRLVSSGTHRLFRPDYEGFPETEDDKLLSQALADYQRDNPDDFSQESSVLKTVRKARRRQDDVVVDLDFIDPAIGYQKGTILLVGKRSMRLRDRATIEDLLSVAEFYQKYKVEHPELRDHFISQGRWPLLP
jgi:hypothetical protein